MARFISNSIPNLLNGVSQQPDTVRLSNQAEAQENAVSDAVFGLGKRNPTEHIAKLNTDTNDDSKVHIINRDVNEQYVLILNDESIQVYDTDGVAKTITNISDLSYLESTDPVNDFNCITVADYTFIVNKTKQVAKDSTVSTARPFEALVYVKNGQYKTEYEVKINGTTQASYTTSDNQADITTDNISTELYNDLNSNLTGYTVSRDGSIIRIQHASTDFTITSNDGLGGDGVVVIKDKINSFSDLPYKGYNDFEVEITGDGGTEYDNYFVKWDGNAWVETVQSGLENSLDSSTMPHLLIRTADGNFRYTPADGSTYTISSTDYDVPLWGNRIVGDDITAPDPSFVGTTINDAFFYRNRLGFLADENVIFSKVGEFFKFYPQTVTTALDDDPVDVAVSHNRVSILKYAVPFSEELLLFSEQTQFILRPEEVLSSKTVAINQATEYEIDTKTRPVGLGQNVYFGFKRGSYAGLREYYISTDTDQKDALDITINIPRYIEGSVTELKGSSSENILLALNSANRNEVYVYKYYFDVNAKPLQRSWSKWVFPSSDVILGGGAIESTFYFVTKRSDGTYLESMNLKTNEVDTNLDFKVLLDRKVKLSGTYDAGTDTTTFTTPYSDTTTKGVVLSGDWTSSQRGRNINISSSTATTVTVNGDYSANDVWVGNKYNFKYKFSKIYVREQKSSGNATSINSGRLQVKKIALIYGDTGFFTATVSPKARDNSVYKFTGQILGSSNFVLGNPILESGEFKVPVQCRNTDVDIEINNDSYLPCNFLSAEWEGIFSVLSERVIT